MMSSFDPDLLKRAKSIVGSEKVKRLAQIEALRREMQEIVSEKSMAEYQSRAQWLGSAAGPVQANAVWPARPVSGDMAFLDDIENPRSGSIEELAKIYGITLPPVQPTRPERPAQPAKWVEERDGTVLTPIFDDADKRVRVSKPVADLFQAPAKVTFGFSIVDAQAANLKTGPVSAIVGSFDRVAKAWQVRCISKSDPWFDWITLTGTVLGVFMVAKYGIPKSFKPFIHGRFIP